MTLQVQGYRSKLAGGPDTRPRAMLHAHRPTRSRVGVALATAGKLTAEHAKPPVADGNADAPAARHLEIRNLVRRGVGATRR